MSPKPLRTVFIYTAHHLGSALVLNALKDCPHLDIVGVVRGGHIPSMRNGRRRRANLTSIRKVGYRYAATLCAYYLTQRTALAAAGAINPWRGKGLLSCEAIARQRACPRHDTNNVNSKASMDFIRSCDADLTVAAFFGQIVHPDTIALPRLGTLNLHPGWLPSYQGALSYVWALVNGETSTGAALHWMDEGIDTGPLLARSRIDVQPGATVQTVMAATALSGADLIASETARLAAGGWPEQIDVTGEETGYYSTPNHVDVRPLLQQQRYFRVADVARLVWTGPDPAYGRGRALKPHLLDLG